METATYAIRWREPDGATFLGRLELAPTAILLEGRANGDAAVVRSLPYDELLGFHIGRGPDERLDGRAALVVERRAGDVLVTSAVVHAGVLTELADRLAGVTGAAPRRATIVVPLAEGAIGRARELAERGPPFDPGETRLIRHELLLTEREAIFVFEADSAAGLEALLGQTALWAAAADWRDLVAGPPRLAEPVYGWGRPAAAAKVGLGF
jgi:hypothetical protein